MLATDVVTGGAAPIPSPGWTSAAWWRRAWMGLAVLVGAGRAWYVRHSMNPGGISFLDLSDAVRDGRWEAVVNGYWQPLYPVVIAAVRTVIPVSAYWEATLVHGVNFLLYLLVLAGFDYLWRGVKAVWRTAPDQPERNRPAEWMVDALAYGWVTWTTVNLITVRHVMPDLLVAASAYTAAGVLVRLITAPSWWRSTALGVVLGLGYLAKAAMFPLAFVYLVLNLLVAPDRRRGAASTVIAGGSFLAVASLLIVPLSLAKGRLTFADTGKLVYAWFVDDVRLYAHWQGEEPGTGEAVHPTRQILGDPPVFEYATPVPGTVPTWTDPSYWHEGLRTRFRIRNQLRALWDAARVYWDLFLRIQPEIFVLGTLLVLVGPGNRGSPTRRVTAVLIVPAVGAFAMYAVVHTEPRFVAAFLTCALLALLVEARIPASVSSSVRAAATIALTAMIVIRIGVGTARTLVSERSGNVHRQWQMAQEARALGVAPGSAIAYIGYPYGAYWARLAGARVVAEVPGDQVGEFWASSPERQRAALEAFRAAGATVLAAIPPPPTSQREGWHQLGRSPQWLRRLNVAERALSSR